MAIATPREAPRGQSAWIAVVQKSEAILKQVTATLTQALVISPFQPSAFPSVSRYELLYIGVYFARPMILADYEVNIQVDGVALVEYDMKVSSDGRSAECMIPSETGKVQPLPMHA
jgi:hypothetical protein